MVSTQKNSNEPSELEEPLPPLLPPLLWPLDDDDSDAICPDEPDDKLEIDFVSPPNVDPNTFPKLIKKSQKPIGVEAKKFQTFDHVHRPKKIPV